MCTFPVVWKTGGLGWVHYFCQCTSLGFVLYVCADGLAYVMQPALTLRGTHSAEGATHGAYTPSDTASEETFSVISEDARIENDTV